MTDDERVCKVVLLGESGVGKTSIINRIIDQTYDSSCVSTINSSQANIYLTINNNKAKFDIWDTAGQERYRAVTSMFYKDASAVILVYDITSVKSFEEIKNYWAQQVKELCRTDVIIAIAANKSDLFEKEMVDQKEATKFANEINAIFKGTSAFTEKGIERIFEEIGKRFFQNNILDEWHNVVKLENKNEKNESKKKRQCC